LRSETVREICQDTGKHITAQVGWYTHHSQQTGPCLLRI